MSVPEEKPVGGRKHGASAEEISKKLRTKSKRPPQFV
jgi:hypothetical protein